MNNFWANTAGVIRLPNNGDAVVPLGWIAISWADTSTPSLSDILAAPQNYSYDATTNTVTANAHLSATQSTTSGVTTLTIALNNPSTSPPTSVAATIGTSTVTIDLTDNVGTLIVQPHKTMASFALPIALSADGTVGTTAAIGSGSKPPVGLQAIAPTTSGDPYLIAPVGAGSTDFVLGVGASAISQAQLLNSIAIALGMLLHGTLNKIIPALQQETWAPVSFSEDELNALADMMTNVVPTIVPQLGTLYPSGGAEMPAYTQMKTANAQIQAILADVNTWLQLPGLA